MVQKLKDAPYLESPKKKTKKLQKEELIFGDSPSLKEKKEKEKEYKEKELNES